MKLTASKVLLIALVVGVGVFALARTAEASHVVAEVSTPDGAEVGSPAQLQVTLRSADADRPVANAAVTVYADASFGGVTGEVELGRAVTDEKGVAVLKYVPRSAGNHELRIKYLAPGGGEPEVVTTSVSVASAPQLHRSTAGIQVPGLNVWLIIALVALVWSFLVSVGLHVVAIARAATETGPMLEPAARPRELEPRLAAPEAGRSEA